MNDKKNKRKLLNLSVEREFQYWLLVRIFGVIILSSVLAALILFFYARHETVTSFYSAHIKIRRVSDLLLPVIFCGASVSLFAGALLAFFLPQKIAGPIFRIENELQAVRAGDLTVVIKLRRHDTLKSFAAKVNEVIADLNAGARELQVEGQKLKLALEREDKAALQTVTGKLQEKLERIKT